MRIIVLVLALGATAWVLYRAAGGGEAETIIPVEQQRALDTAKGLEQVLQDASRRDAQATDESEGDRAGHD